MMAGHCPVRVCLEQNAIIPFPACDSTPPEYIIMRSMRGPCEMILRFHESEIYYFASSCAVIVTADLEGPPGKPLAMTPLSVLPASLSLGPA